MRRSRRGRGEGRCGLGRSALLRGRGIHICRRSPARSEAQLEAAATGGHRHREMAVETIYKERCLALNTKTDRPSTCPFLVLHRMGATLLLPCSTRRRGSDRRTEPGWSCSCIWR